MQPFRYKRSCSVPVALKQEVQVSAKKRITARISGNDAGMRDTLSSGKRGYRRMLAERAEMINRGEDPDAINLSQVNMRKACPLRGDSL